MAQVAALSARRRLSQDFVYLGQYLCDIERFGEVALRSNLQSPPPVLLLGQGGHHDYLDVGGNRVGFQRQSYLIAVHYGHQDVKEILPTASRLRVPERHCLGPTGTASQRQPSTFIFLEDHSRAT